MNAMDETTEKIDSAYTLLSFEDWERRETYKHFSAFTDPFYSISFRVDVTDLYAKVKKEGLSFYLGLTWACTKAMNEVEAFLVSREGDKLLRYEKRHPSFTDMHPGEETYYCVTVPYLEDMAAFCRQSKKISQEQTVFIDMEKEVPNLIFISCVPWVEMTAVKSPRNLAGGPSLDNYIPSLTWGGFWQEGDRKVLTMTIDANHRFVDGYHVGLFAKKLEQILKGLSC